jgi:hypothetical protein
MWLPGLNQLISWNDTYLAKGEPGHAKHLHEAIVLLTMLRWSAVEDGIDPDMSRAFVEARYIVADARNRGRINVSALERLKKTVRKENRK